MADPVDISMEKYRVYTYSDGSQFRIDDPVELFIFEGKSGWTQRVTDANGLTHRPTPGWLAISWQPREGQPAFIA
jgi:hypothetical protein